MPPEHGPLLQEWHARFIRDVGVPSVIALFLIWFLSSQLLSAIEQHSVDTEAWMRQLITISRQICVNTAPDAEARALCLTAQP